MKHRRRLLLIPAYALLAACGCGKHDNPSPPSSPPKASSSKPAAPSQPAPEPPDTTDQQAAATPVSKKMAHGAEPQFNGDRASVCRWLGTLPGVQSAVASVSGTDSNVDVRLRRHVSAAAVSRLAHTVRVYMQQHFVGDAAYEVAQINLLGGGAGGSNAADAEASQEDAAHNAVRAVVTTAVNAGTASGDSPSDTQWHVFVDGDQVE